MMLYLLIIALSLPFIDFFLLFKAVSLIGMLPTVGLVFLTGVAGAALIKREGRDVFRRLTTAVTAKEASRNLIEAALLVFGGIALLTPGFVTDFLGFLMVVRPTRQRLMLWISERMESNAQFEIRTF